MTTTTYTGPDNPAAPKAAAPLLERMRAAAAALEEANQFAELARLRGELVDRIRAHPVRSWSAGLVLAVIKVIDLEFTDDSKKGPGVEALTLFRVNPEKVDEMHKIMGTVQPGDLTHHEMLALLAAIRPAYRRKLDAQRPARVLRLVPRIDEKTRNRRTPQRI